MRPERPWSLVNRLTAWYAISSFLVVLLATAVLDWHLARAVERVVDERLAQEVAVLRRLLRDEPGDLGGLRREVERESADRRATTILVQVLRPDGAVVVETPTASAMLRGRPPLPVAPPDAPPGPSASHGELRLVAAQARVGAGPDERLLVVAIDWSAQRALVTGFRARLGLVLGGLLGLCVVASLLVTRSGLRPLADVVEASRRLGPDAPGQRLDVPGLPRELAALRDVLDGVLGRLEDSIARLSRFSSDIAHELRTPISNLRGEAEVALGRERTPAEYREVLGSCLEEYARLARLIDRLLFLARAEGAPGKVEKEPVDVRKKLQVVVEYYEAQAHDAGVRLELAGPAEPLSVAGDRSLLRSAVANLVENAIRHTPAGGSVTVSAARAADGTVRIVVADTGEGIPPEHLGLVFDRFYRVDRSRDARRGGVGLGLAIVKSVAGLHGGRVECESRVGEGTTMTLVLPAG